MKTNENVLFSNTFGTVTDARVILNYRNGTEEIPIKNLTSVRVQHRRSYFFSIGGLVLGILSFIYLLVNIRNIGSAEVPIVLIFALFFILSGVANWVGHHDLVFSISGKDRKPLKVGYSKTREGIEFAKAVKQLMND